MSAGQAWSDSPQVIITAAVTELCQPRPLASLFTLYCDSGNYAACGFEILLHRKHEPLVYQVLPSQQITVLGLVQVYIPCILFVTVSWISFIIDPKVVPGRMSLLVILFLVIINTFNAVKYV